MCPAHDLPLIAARVNVQAGLFDPAAFGGLSLTGGLEIWIL